MSKVIVIGLDGATWDLLKPWADKGELPALKKLMETGTWGTLQSTIPPATGPAWPSFSTGKNPGKHGIFDFVRLENGSLTLCRAEDIGSETVHDILSKSNLRSIVIGLPLSFPPKGGFNGVMISDFLYPRKEIIPRSKADYIDSYRAFPNLLLMGKAADLLDDMVETAKSQVEVAKELFVKETWDFYFFYSHETDGVSHHFWKEIADNTATGQEAKKVFRIADDFLGWVLDEMDSETTIFLMSDHGFADCPFKINLNNIFMEKGLIKTRTKDISEDETFAKHLVKTFGMQGERAAAPRNSLLSLASYPRARRIPGRIFKRVFGSTKVRYDARIDFGNSKVFVPTSGSMGVYVTEMDGRKHEAIVEEIVETLRQLEYKGRRVFNQVLPKDEVYSGPFMEFSPDILLIPNGFSITPALGNELYGQFDRGASHDLKGIFLAYGSNIRTSGEELTNLKIYDIAPTILHIFNLPIPGDMDGAVLKQLFEPGSEPASRSVEYVGTDEDE